MDFIKHECGVAMVRLLKTGSHYAERYGDLYYGLHLLSLIYTTDAADDKTS
ncbi:MAG: hypothetical protein K2G90_08775 [Muribaculaceae bacterium]|nr:hypothetical protein [Muribaculaceae bacterium]